MRKIRDIKSDDILQLRDIGQPEGAGFGQPSPLGISPDGRHAAFLLNQADAASNRYCRALVLIDLAGPPNPRILDQGGELVTSTFTFRGLRSDSGYPALLTPTWSPDGKWVAWLRRDGSITQVWRASRDGGDGKPVTHSPTDVTDLAWSPDGSTILFVTQPDLEMIRKKIAEEGLAGWLYDDRFMPVEGMWPQLPGKLPAQLNAVNPDSREVRAATEDEQAFWSERQTIKDPALPSSISATGRRAWTSQESRRLFGPLSLYGTGQDGSAILCTSAKCKGAITGLWWDQTGTELRFLRREGWANGELGFYRWRPGAGDPQQLLATTDVLLGCTRATTSLICTSENSVTPRHLIRLDPDTGQITPIFDPNPEFRTIRLGKVQRLPFRNNRGLEAWGDLVLPPNYDGTSRLPLIVVQYTSLGFLRGGTGDEYPIYPFAAAGFAVLSLQQPDHVGKGLPEVQTADDLIVAGNKDWAERRSLLSSLEAGVDAAIAKGVADPKRIGLTGLSNGATTARFALINSDRFAAAAISSCCLDPQSVAIYTGPAFARQMRTFGFPEHGDEAAEFWQPFSLAHNAGRVNRPLLMQLADSEALIALESYTALKAAGQPVELHVFPNELHVKWQPAHRRAIYQRNIDWFRFWLQAQIDPNPGKSDQYRRWKAMQALPDEPAGMMSSIDLSTADRNGSQLTGSGKGEQSR